ncbi:MAG: hypothetical protein SGJ09_17745 [Phycisphaerae bacterium]|nr:hypothetical protein [Phycisphaerae bacterium]
MTNSYLFRAATLTCAATTLLGIAGTAHADVTDNLFFNSTIYDYRITYMTDIDQRRTGLGADGAMYCVPTSSLNLFCYAANHGFPVGGLPLANSMTNAQHGYMTSWLDYIGDLMQTDAQAGTTCCVDSTLQSLVNGSLLKRTTKYISSNFTPGQSSMTQLACNGWIVSFAYGKYTQTGTFQGNPIFARGGGHAVTLTRSWRSGDSRIIKYRDPNNNSSLTTQSAHANTVHVPRTTTGYFDSAGLRSLTGLFLEDGKTRFIDAIMGIRPIYGIAFLNTGDSQGGGSITVLDPVPFEGSEGAFQPSIAISPFVTIFDVNLHPDATSALVLSKSVFSPLSLLRTLDLSTGALATLTPAPLGLERIEWSGKSYIYGFSTSDKLFRLDSEGNEVFSTTAIPSPSAIAADDAHDALWVLSVSERKLVKLSDDFSETLLTLIIPTIVPMSGKGDVIFDPNSGFPWIRTDASDTIYGIKPNPTAGPTIYPASLGVVDTMSISDDRLYVSSDGLVKVFKPAAASPGWTPDTTSPFNGLPGGGRIAMLRNSTNYDPNIHSGPKWFNLQPQDIDKPAPEVNDCLADQNADSMVDAADLAVLLGAWGTSGDLGDINQDAIVNAADLALLLDAWGRCPN